MGPRHLNRGTQKQQNPPLGVRAPCCPRTCLTSTLQPIPAALSRIPGARLGGAVLSAYQHRLTSSVCTCAGGKAGRDNGSFSRVLSGSWVG